MNNLLPDVTIELLTKFSSKDAKNIKRLATRLGSNYQPLTDKDLKDIISSPTTYLFIARESQKKELIGMATLAIYRIPYVKKANFDDLIVDDKYRGNGIGQQLVEKILLTANELGATYIDFTSNPKRIKANKLYEKLGFKKRDTNVYRLTYD
ncbi:MAG TPA: GNAT family N-acetyltransferase [Candidatus Limnocylindrales bacterium]|nr:GNAT family N-acetyltransferase [Candidatus Limnocylindrales bacterium]